MTLMWPEFDTALVAETAPRLAVLNKVLGSGVLNIQEDLLQLSNVPDFWLDVARFRQLLRAAINHTHTSVEGVPACIDVLSKRLSCTGQIFWRGSPCLIAPSLTNGSSSRLKFTQRAGKHVAAISKSVQHAVRIPTGD